jgi:predicted DNA-binding protein with PD1-like motif
MSEVSCFPYLWVSQFPTRTCEPFRMKWFLYFLRMLREREQGGRKMQYSSARMGRILVARVDHGEDLLREMQNILEKEDISRAVMLFLGAIGKGSLVTGPEEPVIPPTPHFMRFGGGWEVVGVATVYPGEDGPAIHLHGSAGRGDRALTGCLRERAEVYLLVEVVILELLDLPVARRRDKSTGLDLPDFGN